MGATQTVHRRRLSIDEFHRLGEAGVLRENDRIELVDGEMIERAPIGPLPLAKVNRLARMLSLAVGADAIVSKQNPIALPPRTELQPDIALLKPRADDYAGALPVSTDVLLIIEVADTTLAYDSDVNVPMYARCGIPEVWLFDLQGGVLLVHRDPAAESYRSVLMPEKDETILPVLLPGVVVGLAAVWR